MVASATTSAREQSAAAPASSLQGREQGWVALCEGRQEARGWLHQEAACNAAMHSACNVMLWLDQASGRSSGGLHQQLLAGWLT